MEENGVKDPAYLDFLKSRNAQIEGDERAKKCAEEVTAVTEKWNCVLTATNQIGEGGVAIPRPMIRALPPKGES